MSFERQAVVFYTAMKGYLNDVPIEKIREAEAKLLEYVEKLHENDILKPIRESGDLDEKVENKLKEALPRFLETFKKV